MNKRIAFMMAACLTTSGMAFAGDCPGDCNGDGVANILDFVCFQGEWQNQTAAGDCDGNGLYNILDFVCFQGAWQDFANGGCQGGGDPLNDNFDGYELGSVCGQGGWTSWDENPDVCGQVSDTYANSGTQSLLVDGTQGLGGDDTVYTWDISGGQYTFSVMTYVPDDATGEGYIILLNTYSAGGAKNWSLQVHLNADFGTVEADFNGELALLVKGEWVEFKAQIDLDADLTQYFYNGEQFVFDKSWIDGVSGGGQPTIQALDLYGNEPGLGAQIWYDDVKLVEGLN